MLVYLSDIWIYQQGLRQCYATIQSTLAHQANHHRA
jgi:hypothetical protein